MKKQRILVIDDEPKIVEVVKSYLEKSGFLVSYAFRGTEALNIFETAHPDLIILDLMLPDMPGEEICGIIRRKSRVPIIMLSAKSEEDNILLGLKIGADDYVTKPFSPRQLVARVNALLRRASGSDAVLSDVLSFGNGELVIDNLSHEVRKSGKIVSLTPNEYKFLITLAKNPGKVFTREELILAAFGGDYFGYDRAIDSHVKNLRRKIEDHSKNPKYILTVHGIGYRFGGEKNDI